MLASGKEKVTIRVPDTKEEFVKDAMHELASLVASCKDNEPQDILSEIKLYIDDDCILDYCETLDKTLEAMISSNEYNSTILKSYDTHETLSRLRARNALAEIASQLLACNDEIGLISLIGTLTHDEFCSPETILGLCDGIGVEDFLNLYFVSMLYPGASGQVKTIKVLVE